MTRRLALVIFMAAVLCASAASTLVDSPPPAQVLSDLTSGKVPCAIEGDSLCRAIFGHPELSTSSRLLVSYYDPAATPQYNPAAGPEGHVMVAGFPW